MAEAMNDPVAIGLKRRESITGGITDGFGTFVEKLKYENGCVLSSEFTKGVGEVSFKTAAPDGTKRTYAVGPTPNEWNPAVGGKKIGSEGAGEPGAFLLAVSTTDPDGNSESSFRYLDPADCDGATVEIGQSPALSPNEARGRQIQIRGQITEVAGFIPQQ